MTKPITAAVAMKHAIAAFFRAGRFGAICRKVRPRAMRMRPEASTRAPVVMRYTAAARARRMIRGRENTEGLCTGVVQGSRFRVRRVWPAPGDV